MAKHIRVPKDFTYFAIVKEAIKESPFGKVTSNDIFNYVSNKHPNLFKPSNSNTWKGNIRQLLSKRPEFIKIPQKGGGKLNWWIYKSIEDVRKEEDELRSCLIYPFVDKSREGNRGDNIGNRGENREGNTNRGENIGSRDNRGENRMVNKDLSMVNKDLSMMGNGKHPYTGKRGGKALEDISNLFEG